MSSSGGKGKDRYDDERDALFGGGSGSGSRSHRDRSGRERSRSKSRDFGRELNGSRSSSRRRPSHQAEVGGRYEERYGRQITRDREDDPTYIKSELQRTQQADVNATRNMIRLLQESTAVSEASIEQLDQQGQSLDRSELKALATNVSAKQAREEARDLKKYGKIFAISWPSWTKSRQRKELEKAEAALRAQERERIHAEQEMRREEDRRREDRFERDKNSLLGSMDSKMDEIRASRVGGSRQGRSERSRSRDGGGQRRQRHFEDDGENSRWEANEQEVDQNLNQISSLLSNLKVNATAMGSRITDQSRQIERINRSTDDTSSTLQYTKKELRKI